MKEKLIKNPAIKFIAVPFMGRINSIENQALAKINDSLLKDISMGFRIAVFDFGF
ncbi:MAG TPA: hypothetical protein VG367_14835 [Mucilaginibacter sp.]|jgi:hypothetical protein|nr:hypothetical protein [Mucilaginibacter sp.]